MEDHLSLVGTELVMLVEYQIAQLVQVSVILVVMVTWMVELEPVVDFGQWVFWLEVEW